MESNADKGIILTILDITIILTLEFLNKNGVPKKNKNLFPFITSGEIAGLPSQESFQAGILQLI
jgi:hypothetical protein